MGREEKVELSETFFSDFLPLRAIANPPRVEES